LSPTDATLNGVRTQLQAAAAAGVAAAAFSGAFELPQIGGAMLAAFFALALDQVVNGGGGEALLVDTLGRALRPEYGDRVALHESGHFMVAYLLGLLPSAYTLSSLDAFRRRAAAAAAQFGCTGRDAALVQVPRAERAGRHPVCRRRHAG